MSNTELQSSGQDRGLRVQNLTIELNASRRSVTAVQSVSLEIDPGRTFALAGESGSGKSLLGMAIAGLLPDVARVTAGRVSLGGRSLLDATASQRRRIAGREIGVIFQEPSTALNPVLSVGSQLAEVPRLHGYGAAQSRNMALSMLERVHIAAPQRVWASYPHELSGGMRQRVLIAMALILGPALVVADEPTTALDVTLQAEILSLIQSLQKDHGAAMFIVSHDLPMLAEVADEVAVMVCGRIVERAPAAALFANPRHPYTQGLLAARPPLTMGRGARRPLLAIEGSVPPPGRWPLGCGFAPRCALAQAHCHAAVPALTSLGHQHQVACFEAG